MVFIVIGGVKAAQAAHKEYKKEKERSAVILDVTAPTGRGGNSAWYDGAHSGGTDACASASAAAASGGGGGLGAWRRSCNVAGGTGAASSPPVSVDASADLNVAAVAAFAPPKERETERSVVREAEREVVRETERVETVSASDIPALCAADEAAVVRCRSERREVRSTPHVEGSYNHANYVVRAGKAGKARAQSVDIDANGSVRASLDEVLGTRSGRGRPAGSVFASSPSLPLPGVPGSCADTDGQSKVATSPPRMGQDVPHAVGSFNHAMSCAKPPPPSSSSSSRRKAVDAAAPAHAATGWAAAADPSGALRKSASTPLPPAVTSARPVAPAGSFAAAMQAPVSSPDSVSSARAARAFAPSKRPVLAPASSTSSMYSAGSMARPSSSRPGKPF